MGLAGLQERVQCAMGVLGASTLGAVARVNLTFGCVMGAATLGEEGRLNLTFLGVGSILGDPGGLGGKIAKGRGGLGGC
jgi:hypothetical protein